jgi:hypothetical protein
MALSTLPTSTRKKIANDYQKTNKYTYRVGIDENLQPLCKIEEIFVDMTARACKLGFKKVVNHLKNRKLRVATMCSGTESPILALRLVSDGGVAPPFNCRVTILTNPSVEKGGYSFRDSTDFRCGDCGLETSLWRTQHRTSNYASGC